MTSRHISTTICLLIFACSGGARTAVAQSWTSIGDGSASAAPTETVLYSFQGGSDGANPFAGLIADESGNLYGTTINSTEGYGNVFRLSPRGTVTVLHSFTGFPSDGAVPLADLIADSSGNLYGTTYIGGGSGYGVVFKVSADGTSYTVLHSFEAGTPVSGLIADSSGNLYGTRFGSGEAICFACGTVFKLSPDGTETQLHIFCTTDCSDGQFPYGGVIADRAGNLYGTTYSGGVSGCLRSEGCGVVFKLSPGGVFTVLHFFTGFPGDGGNPQAGLIADRSGNLYGTTYHGGGPSSCGEFYGAPLGCGTVFKLAGTGFVVPVAFAGTPGKPNCHGQSVSALARQYAGLEAAAAALGFPSVRALQDDIRAFCAGA
jgi:uncharacterized repeat protein (TIGR03803 family)